MEKVTETGSNVLGKYPEFLQKLGAAYDESTITLRRIEDELIEHHKKTGVEAHASYTKDLANKLFIHGSIQLFLNSLNKGTKK